MNVIAEIFDLFAVHGSSNYDEGVTLEDHSLQTAALAVVEAADEELVVAALLHDLGHLLQARARGNENYLATDWDHDVVAAEWLRPHFVQRIVEAVGQHVAAKRWLCATDPTYVAGLSAASVASLASQGGPFTPADANAWVRFPGADDAIRLRRWDDNGKVAGLNIPALDDYRPLLGAYLRAP